MRYAINGLGETNPFESFNTKDWAAFGIQTFTAIASIFYGWRIGKQYGGTVGAVLGAAGLVVVVKIPEVYILKETLDPIYLRETETDYEKSQESIAVAAQEAQSKER